MVLSGLHYRSALDAHGGVTDAVQKSESILYAPRGSRRGIVPTDLLIISPALMKIVIADDLPASAADLLREVPDWNVDARALDRPASGQIQPWISNTPPDG